MRTWREIDHPRDDRGRFTRKGFGGRRWMERSLSTLQRAGQLPTMAQGGRLNEGTPGTHGVIDIGATRRANAGFERPRSTPAGGKTAATRVRAVADQVDVEGRPTTVDARTRRVTATRLRTVADGLDAGTITPTQGSSQVSGIRGGVSLGQDDDQALITLDDDLRTGGGGSTALRAPAHPEVRYDNRVEAARGVASLDPTGGLTNRGMIGAAYQRDVGRLTTLAGSTGNEKAANSTRRVALTRMLGNLETYGGSEEEKAKVRGLLRAYGGTPPAPDPVAGDADARPPVAQFVERPQRQEWGQRASQVPSSDSMVQAVNRQIAERLGETTPVDTSVDTRNAGEVTTTPTTPTARPLNKKQVASLHKINDAGEGGLSTYQIDPHDQRNLLASGDIELVPGTDRPGQGWGTNRTAFRLTDQGRARLAEADPQGITDRRAKAQDKIAKESARRAAETARAERNRSEADARKAKAQAEGLDPEYARMFGLQAARDKARKDREQAAETARAEAEQRLTAGIPSGTPEAGDTTTAHTRAMLSMDDKLRKRLAKDGITLTEEELPQLKAAFRAHGNALGAVAQASADARAAKKRRDYIQTIHDIEGGNEYAALLDEANATLAARRTDLDKRIAASEVTATALDNEVKGVFASRGKRITKQGIHTPRANPNSIRDFGEYESLSARMGRQHGLPDARDERGTPLRRAVLAHLRAQDEESLNSKRIRDEESTARMERNELARGSYVHGPADLEAERKAEAWASVNAHQQRVQDLKAHAVTLDTREKAARAEAARLAEEYRTLPAYEPPRVVTPPPPPVDVATLDPSGAGGRTDLNPDMIRELERADQRVRGNHRNNPDLAARELSANRFRDRTTVRAGFIPTSQLDAAVTLAGDYHERGFNRRVRDAVGLPHMTGYEAREQVRPNDLRVGDIIQHGGWGLQVTSITHPEHNRGRTMVVGLGPTGRDVASLDPEVAVTTRRPGTTPLREPGEVRRGDLAVVTTPTRTYMVNGPAQVGTETRVYRVGLVDPDTGMLGLSDLSPEGGGRSRTLISRDLPEGSTVHTVPYDVVDVPAAEDALRARSDSSGNVQSFGSVGEAREFLRPHLTGTPARSDTPVETSTPAAPVDTPAAPEVTRAVTVADLTPEQRQAHRDSIRTHLESRGFGAGRFEEDRIRSEARRRAVEDTRESFSRRLSGSPEQDAMEARAVELAAQIAEHDAISQNRAIALEGLHTIVDTPHGGSPELRAVAGGILAQVENEQLEGVDSQREALAFLERDANLIFEAGEISSRDNYWSQSDRGEAYNRPIADLEAEIAAAPEGLSPEAIRKAREAVRVAAIRRSQLANEEGIRSRVRSVLEDVGTADGEDAKAKILKERDRQVQMLADDAGALRYREEDALAEMRGEIAKLRAAEQRRQDAIDAAMTPEQRRQPLLAANRTALATRAREVMAERGGLLDMHKARIAARAKAKKEAGLPSAKEIKTMGGERRMIAENAIRAVEAASNTQVAARNNKFQADIAREILASDFPVEPEIRAEYERAIRGIEGPAYANADGVAFHNAERDAALDAWRAVSRGEDGPTGEPLGSAEVAGLSSTEREHAFNIADRIGITAARRYIALRRAAAPVG